MPVWDSQTELCEGKYTKMFFVVILSIKHFKLPPYETFTLPAYDFRVSLYYTVSCYEKLASGAQFSKSVLERMQWVINGN